MSFFGVSLIRSPTVSDRSGGGGGARAPPTAQICEPNAWKVGMSMGVAPKSPLSPLLLDLTLTVSLKSMI